MRSLRVGSAASVLLMLVLLISACTMPGRGGSGGGVPIPKMDEEEKEWQTQMKKVLAEAQRVLQTGGWLMIIETMTTGSHTPAPPKPGLAEYYRWLEEEFGFRSQVIQTDFLFDDLEQAIRYAQFFFGDELGKKVRKENWARLPEWTGIWSKRFG